MIMEADKFQVLQVSRQAGSPGELMMLHMKAVGSRLGKSRCCLSSLKAGKKPVSQVEGAQAGRTLVLTEGQPSCSI